MNRDSYVPMALSVIASDDHQLDYIWNSLNFLDRIIWSGKTHSKDFWGGTIHFKYGPNFMRTDYIKGKEKIVIALCLLALTLAQKLITLSGIRAYFFLIEITENQLQHLTLWSQQLLDSCTFHWEIIIVGIVGPLSVSHLINTLYRHKYR